MSEAKSTFEQTCFVISPIGTEGTEIQKSFREVLDYIISPSVQEAGYDLQVIRADDINRAGSFIKDILEYISSSYIVIADLTGQNPNVFYELGVRHTISPRTILIAQNIDDIPSDLREYRTIIYGTSAKEAAEFEKRVVDYLKDIDEDPHRFDNPVLDRLDAVIGTRLGQLQEQNAQLRANIEKLLKGGKQEQKKAKNASAIISLSIRLERILKIKGAEIQMFIVSFQREENGKRVNYEIPDRQGAFHAYFVKDNGSIADFLYLSGPHGEVDFVKELADIRVLMEQCSRGQNVHITFAIVSAQDYSDRRDEIHSDFDKIRQFIDPNQGENFALEIWDEPRVKDMEHELGIKLE